MPGHRGRLLLGPAPRRLGARRRLDHVGLPWRPADGRRPGRRHRRTARLPAQPGSPQRLGEHGGPAARGHRRPHPRPDRRPHRAGRIRPGDGHAARRGHAPGRGPRAADLAGRARRRARGGPDAPALAGHHQLPGRLRRRGGRARHAGLVRHLSHGGRLRHAQQPRGRRPVVGPRPRPGPDRRPAGPARAGERWPVQRWPVQRWPVQRWPVPGDYGQADARRRVRDVHRRDVVAVPGPARACHRSPGTLVHRAGGPARSRPAARRGRIPAALPRHRRSCRQHRARRDRGASGRAAPGRAPPPGAPAVHHPAGHGQVRRATARWPTSSRCGRARKRRWKS